MVILDVVYNHFGPEGNYLYRLAPPFFTERHHTPWGAAIDFEGPQSRVVRDFFVHNALYWLTEFDVDGLRLDAVHAIVDASQPHLLDEIAAAVRAGPGRRRERHLVMENDRNEVRRLARDADRQPLRYTAQWNDDFHHALHTVVTGETTAYYADYAVDPVRLLGRCLAEGFAYQGEWSPFRERKRGEASGALPPEAFVNFLQNHDQVGNRALGDRLESLASEGEIEAALAVTLLAPMVPMLFMGEEWGSKVPFPFFCDFEGDLARAVRNGRKQEYKWAYDRYGDEVPDPLDPATFQSAVLDWDSRNLPAGAKRLALVRDLLRVRRRDIAPRLAGASFGTAHAHDDGLLTASWRMGDRTTLHLIANLSAQHIANPSPHPDVAAIWGGVPGDRLPPWSVFWRIGG